MKWKPNKSSFRFVHELYFFITTKKPHCSLWSWTVKKEVLGSKRSFFFSCGLRPSLSSLSLPSASWLVASAAGSDAKCSAAVEPWARSRDNNQRSGKHGLNTAVTPGPLLPAPRSALQGANGAVQQEKLHSSSTGKMLMAVVASGLCRPGSVNQQAQPCRRGLCVTLPRPQGHW